MKISDEDKKVAGAACVGATAALVLALFMPPAALLGAGLLAVGGAVAYRRYASRGGAKAGDTGSAGSAENAGSAKNAESKENAGNKENA